MVRTAQERISDLFALAEQESARGHPTLPDRYVGLARRIGMRYNVRLPVEYRELYCRRCSAHWVEGRTVRTRLRGGLRVRTCLRCGWLRRVGISRRRGSTGLAVANPRVATEPEVAMVSGDLTSEDTEEE
jgi:ribonuclease P protein subunit RPR2